MRCFIPLEEDLIMKLWMQDPTLVAPFPRPFVTPSLLARLQGERLNAQSKHENPSQSPFVKRGRGNYSPL